MEFPFSSNEKGVGYWAAPGSGVQMDSSGQIDNGVRIPPVLDDPFGNFDDFMNFDFAGLYNSGLESDQIFSSYMLPNCTPTPYESYDTLNFAYQGSPAFSDQFGALGSSYVFGDNSNLVPASTQITYPIDLSNVNEPQPCEDSAFIPRSLGPSLDEKMLRALSLFKEFSGVGILAQVWVPIKRGDKFILSTYAQPFLLDKMLEGYREVSRRYAFSAEERPGAFPGLPGRVFMSKVPEWTSNVAYYNRDEYLRVEHAADHNIRSSIAVPVFDSSDVSCCAVLELVTMKEQLNFDAEMEKVCTALQVVNLRTTPPRRNNKSLSRNQRAAFAEIAYVMRAVCHAHNFPLALTWVPCICSNGDKIEIVKADVHWGRRNPNGKYCLCVEKTACYVNDKQMEDFVNACAERYLGEGQGIVGKALQSNQPFFFPDIKAYNIREYPFVHHARRFGLNAAVAIRLRSTYTGDDDYLLEFFLPVNAKGSAEQQLLLNNLSCTMQRLCRTLRTVSDADLCGEEGSKTKLSETTVPTSERKRSFDAVVSNNRMNCIDSRQKAVELNSNGPSKQIANGSWRRQGKKKSTSEKTISLSVLQQYFSGSLKDAAKSIGVCPTTLKRICRQHGISRWPSRKISKVNRSLRKIQTVLDSVQGVEGALKFDPTKCGFVSAAGGTSHALEIKKPYVFSENNIPAIRSPDSLPQETNINNENFATLNPGNTLEPGSDIPMELTGPPNLPNGSDLIVIGSSSDEEGKTASELPVDNDSKITVKATYRDERVRFRFEPGYGCFQLYEEVAKRFRIQNGMFQLKYLDDEEEWVMLADNSDLYECMVIMEDSGSKSVKLRVCDSPIAIGSWGSSSNCFVMGGGL